MAFGQAQATKISYFDGRPGALHLQRAQLLIHPGQSKQREVLTEQDIISVGSNDDNTVCIDDDDTISRHHCRIVQEGDEYVLIDRTSTNGTHVNGVRVREAVLAHGDTIAVGNTHMRFHHVREQVDIKPSESDRFGGIVGRSVKMREIFSILEKVAPTSATILIEGETGTGKEVIAQTIHKMSARSKGPMVVFDCSSIPASLIESELFGHEKGSFTGAVMSRKGLFEMADGGTIFMDELGELSIDLQPKLLRVLEQREIRPVGANKATPINVRVISATNRALEDEIRDGGFRQDLFYRLNVVRIYLPPLRARREDISLLVQHFLSTKPFNVREDGTQRVVSIEQEAMDLLESYDWPGNVRELVNVIERACSLAETNCLRVTDLPDHISGRLSHADAMGSQSNLEDEHSSQALWSDLPQRDSFNDRPFKEAKEEWISIFEQDYITELLVRHKCNISQAAREADIDRKYFRKLMHKYDIEADDLIVE